MSSGFKIMWREFKPFAVIIAFTLVALVCVAGSALYKSHQDSAFYDKLKQLESKSEAHQMILNNFIKCMVDDAEVESNCITNTILLAEVNGYKKNIGEVFHDAGIPRK